MSYYNRKALTEKDMNLMTNVFIIGSKGIPAQYGGFETFVDCLTALKSNEEIKYHVSCLGKDSSEFEYNNARCFNVPVQDIGSAKAILYDLKSLYECINYIEKNKIKNSIIYILACRIGPFMFLFKNRLKKLNIKVYVNPDGHEWLRSKWNMLIRKYWLISEKYMVKHSDLLICDSKAIEVYIKDRYRNFVPNTIFIPYGALIEKTESKNDLFEQWCCKNSVVAGKYYLVVGRFVPENNYEIILREFMASSTEKDLIIISNFEENKFYEHLLNRTSFSQDKRIKFVGTVYNNELLKTIREEAYAYIHGHEVGGTNPSLLEALAATKINILLNVIFNIEVGQEAVLYFDKNIGSLKTTIENAENMNESQIMTLELKSKQRIADYYAWDKIVCKYESLFLR